MTYLDKSQMYRNNEYRERSEMCAREQGMIYSNDGRPDIAALGRGVTSGNMQDIDALQAAAVSKAGADPSTDPGLLAAIQAVWPDVAAARYPQ